VHREALRRFTDVGRFEQSNGTSRRLKAVFIGDSTTRNQYQLLCDLLKPKTSRVTYPWKDMQEAWVYRVDGIILLGHFAVARNHEAYEVQGILDGFRAKLAMPSSEKFSFIYFGCVGMTNGYC